MSQLIIGQDQVVAQWVAERVPGMRSGHEFGKCIAVGVQQGAKLVGGIVFSNFVGFDVTLSAAATTPRWGSKNLARKIFNIPFEQWGCKRCSAMVSRKNKPARKFIERLGFKQEGVRPFAYDGKADAVIYGMVKEDCKWIK
jgi:RimJ/RimL family protein N-acetyltransferase